MKNSFLLTSLLLIIFGIKVFAGVNPDCYVKTGERTYFGQKLKFGINTVKVITDDGTVVKVPIKEVNSYNNGKKLYELLPTFNMDFDTSGYAMMEFIKSKCGLRLYRFYKRNEVTPVIEYYVFKPEGLHLIIDEKNAATVCSFFGIEARFEL